MRWHLLFLVCFFVCLFSFFCFFGCFFFPFFASEWKTAFPLKKGIFCLFLSVSLCFSWAFFGLPLVQFLFLCLSLVFSFFLPSCLSFFCFLLVPSFSVFLSFSVFFAFVSWKLTTSKDSIAKFFSSILCLFWFPVLFLFQIPFSYLCFSWYSVMFFVQHQCFWFQKIHKLKTRIFGQKGSCNKTFFYNLCFAKCEKLSFLFCPFFGHVLVDVQKHYKIMYFSTLSKAKKT